MSTKLNIDLKSAQQAPWFGRTGIGANPNFADVAWSNNFTQKWKTNAGTGDVLGVGVNTSDQLELGGSVYVPQRYMKTFTLATNASITTQAFWIADIACKVTGINCIFATADGATNTAYISKATGTQAPGSGTTLQSGTFNMNATANTLQSATLTTASNFPSILTLAVGDRLVFNLASAVTSLAGVVITMAMTPGNKSLTAQYVMNANGDIATSTLFLSDGEYVVTGVQAIWSTKGSNGGTVTYDVTKDTSTNAPGAGTSILTAAVSVKTTANTVSTPALAASAATLRLTQSDRLAVKMTGTLTALAGLVIVVSLRPIQGIISVTYNLKTAANLGVDTDFFIADRTYEVACVGMTYSVANGATLTGVITRDSSTTAPGGGTSLLSGTINLNTTANTPLFGTLLGNQSCYLLQGDRLGFHYSTTVTSLAGLGVTVKLIPR